MKTIPTFLILSLLLSGCATNAFTKFYSDHTASYRSGERLLPYSGTTEIRRTNDMRGDGERLFRGGGYAILGESSFEAGGNVTERTLRAQAKRVGADIVLYTNSYKGSYQASLPLLQYNPGQVATTTSSGTVRATSPTGHSLGTGTYSGTATTTTPGTFSTNIVPVTVHRYSYGATFWRKTKPPLFGVYVEDAPNWMREGIRWDAGVTALVVLDGSPASRAGIRPGDIIVFVGGEAVGSPSALSGIITRFAGQEFDVVVIRGDEEKTLRVKLNPAH